LKNTTTQTCRSVLSNNGSKTKLRPTRCGKNRVKKYI
jgi:hypothetical protein